VGTKRSKYPAQRSVFDQDGQNHCAFQYLALDGAIKHFRQALPIYSASEPNEPSTPANCPTPNNDALGHRYFRLCLTIAGKPGCKKDKMNS
jgi:hypothetical protein